MHVTKNMHLDEVYKLYWEHLAKFCMLVEINANNHDFYGFFLFHHENRLVDNFHYYIRSQRVEIRKHGEFYGNREVHLFGTAPIMSIESFFLYLIFLER